MVLTEARKAIRGCAYATINYTANLGKVVTYKGKLDLFSNYKHKLQNVDLYFTNLFAAKLSKVLSATWSLTLIYDDDVKLAIIIHHRVYNYNHLSGLGYW